MARPSTPTTTGDPSSISLEAMGVQPTQAEEIRQRIRAGAKRERARRRQGGLAVALDALATASPEDLAEHWPRVREVYSQYPSAQRDLARAHPAPFIEYVHRINNPKEPEVHGQPITLGTMHVEMIQAMLHHRLVACQSAREHLATTVSLAMIEWMLGTNRDRRIKIAGESGDKAKERVVSIRDNIASNPRIREVFPGLRPATPWGTHAFSVHRSSRGPDASVTGGGIVGGVTGGRTDLGYYDDVVGYRNAIERPAYKPKVRTSFFSDWFGTGAQGIHWYQCNYWDADDLSEQLRAMAQQDADTTALPSGGTITRGRDWWWLQHAVDADTLRSPWSERWTPDKIAVVRRTTPSSDFARGWLCRAPTREENEFRDEWMRFADTPPRERFELVIGMVDTATGLTPGTAYTAMGVIGIYMVPESEVNPLGLAVHVVDVQRMRGALLDRCSWVESLISRYDIDIVGVENASDGVDLAGIVGDHLALDIDMIPAIHAKRERLNRHMPIFRAGLVTWARHLHPEYVRATGDDDAANPIDEIMGRIATMDCADVVEMCLRRLRDEYLFDLSDYDDDVADETEAANMLGIDRSADVSHDRGDVRDEHATWWGAPRVAAAGGASEPEPPSRRQRGRRFKPMGRR